MPQINKIKYTTLSATASMRSGAGPVISIIDTDNPFVLMLYSSVFYLLCGELWYALPGWLSLLTVDDGTCTMMAGCTICLHIEAALGCEGEA